MKKGSIFEQHGVRYETCTDGIEHVPKNKSKCIRTKGESKCVTVEQAINAGLIRHTATPESDNLFTGVQKGDGNKSGTGASPPQNTRTKSDNIYFMPVDQLRAQVFLSHGLIYPAAYEKAGLSADFDDIQRFAPSDLTVFDSPQPLKDNQLLLNILLYPDEVADADRTGNALHLAIPLPISRLVAIEVPRQLADMKRYVDGWVKPDVPCPRGLFRPLPKQSASSEKNIGESFSRPNIKPVPEVFASIAKFDRYMGIMAFLRNATRYFSEKTGFYADYPDAFFQVAERLLNRAGLVNSSARPPAPLLLALLDLNTEISSTAECVLALAKSQDPYIDKDKARAFATDIYKGADAKDTLAQAFKTLFSRDYRSAIQVLQRPELPVEAAVLAALFKFSNRQSGDQRTVKQRLHEDWSKQTDAELALAALGAYHGYTSMDARETSLYSVHPMIRPLIEEHPAIKFDLGTVLEREIIEAIHQRAFAPKEPMPDTSTLFKALSSTPGLEKPLVQRLLVHDSTYSVADLLVRRYEVTLIGKIIQRFRAWRGDTIDEQSEAGRYLMSQCLFLADEYEISKKAGKQVLRYKIAKSKVIELITDQRITVNPRVLDAALEEDCKDYAR